MYFFKSVFNHLSIGYVNETISNIGSVLVILGTCFRLWAVIVLGRHFSLQVSLESTQQLIQNGPYRILRHPAYTGILLSFIGIGITFNTWVGSLVMLFFFMIVFGDRIQIEERALIERFQDEYIQYSKK